MSQIVFADASKSHSHGLEAPSFESLAEIALQNLRLQGSSGIVCGPITTGGTGDQTFNLQIFSAMISGLRRYGSCVFTQLPYEYGLRKLEMAWFDEGNSGYPMPILDRFYAKLFESGLITRAWFIKGWESSFGARWEREKLSKLGVVINDLSREDVAQFMLFDRYPQDHVKGVVRLLC